MSVKNKDHSEMLFIQKKTYVFICNKEEYLVFLRPWMKCQPWMEIQNANVLHSKVTLFFNAEWRKLPAVTSFCVPSVHDLSALLTVKTNIYLLLLVIHYNYHHYLLGKLDLKAHFLPCLQPSKTKNKMKVHLQPFRKAVPERQMSHSKSTLSMPIPLKGAANNCSTLRGSCFHLRGSLWLLDRVYTSNTLLE